MIGPIENSRGFAAPLRQGLVLLLLLGSSLRAAPPAWWGDPATKVWDSNLASNNQGPANLGQLKNMAKMARLYLNSQLDGGAGSEIDALVAGFGTGLTVDQKADQYKPVNLGQLKFVAKAFYKRLAAVGYDSRGNLIVRGYPADWAYDTPWNPFTDIAQNYVPASIGQLKMVFSFDLSTFAVGSNGIPDNWETQHFGAPGVSATADPDQDGLSNLQEYQSKTDPNAKDNPAVKLKVSIVVK